MVRPGHPRGGPVDNKQLRDDALNYHSSNPPGKVTVVPTKPHGTQRELSLAYSPGVAYPCEEIKDNADDAYKYTSKGNLVAVISNGTAVLGLGDIGALASKPVMEGKGLLFKAFADIDVFDIEVDRKDVDQFVEAVKAIAPTFGGINLEDISAPRCFEIEDSLRAQLDIPVFHDDQHGTAVVVSAALLNAAKLVKKNLDELNVVVAGVGASGVACVKMLLSYGVKNIIGCDRSGAVYKGRPDNMNFMKNWFAENTNHDKKKGSIGEVIEGADLFLGLSGPGTITVDDIKKMNKDPIVFAMANPDPEILPHEAGPHVAIMATGRSDFANQINNVSAFPGIFRGALDVQATTVNDEMKMAAAEAIASTITSRQLQADYIIPSVFNRNVAPAVARAVSRAARVSGVARRSRSH